MHVVAGPSEAAPWAESRRAARVAWSIAVLFVVYATTLPFDFGQAPSFARAELIPVWNPATGRLHSIPDMVQNVLLFVPFGLFGVPASEALSRLARRPSGASLAVLLVALGGLGLSACLEGLQTMSLTRQPSVTDLVTDAAGAGLGALAFAVFAPRIAPTFARIAGRQADAAARLVAAVWLAIAAGQAWAPFIPSLDVGHLRGKVRALLDDPLGQAALGGLPMELASSTALVAALAIALRARPDPHGRRSPAVDALAAAALGGALALVFEAGQLPLVHHAPTALALAARALGAAVGAVLGVALAERSRRSAPALSLGAVSRATALVPLGLALIPLLRALAPFRLADDEALAAKLAPDVLLVHLVPFGMLFAHLEVSTVTNVFGLALTTYAPLGWALAARGASRGRVLVVALVLAEVLEALQLPLEGRTFDVTEGLIAAVGALIGALTLEHARRHWIPATGP
jgi:VanZ family protein